MIGTLFLREPARDLTRDPRWRLRCDGCGRFAVRKTSEVIEGYYDNTPDSCDWNPGTCFCTNCRKKP